MLRVFQNSPSSLQYHFLNYSAINIIGLLADNDQSGSEWAGVSVER